MAQETGFDDPIRNSWKKGSKLEIYSESKKQWFNGKIERIFHDAEGEWLAIKYNGFNLKEVQRFTQFIRPIQRRKKKQTKTPNGNGKMNHRDTVQDDDDSKETEPPKQQKQSNDQQQPKTMKVIDTANDDRKSSNIEPTESTQSIHIDSDHHQSNDIKKRSNDECQSLELRQLQLIQKVNTMQKRMDSMARSVGTSLDTIRSLEKHYHSEDVMVNVTADDVQCVMENVNESISCLFHIAADIKVTADRYNVRLPDEENIESLLSSLRETEDLKDIEKINESSNEQKDSDIVVDNELKPRKSKGPKVDPLLCRMDDALRMVNDAIEQHKVAVYDFLDEDIRSVTALFSEVKEQLTAS